MGKSKSVSVTMVNILVVFAVLLILTALVVPTFIPPEGQAATRANASGASSASVLANKANKLIANSIR